MAITKRGKVAMSARRARSYSIGCVLASALALIALAPVGASAEGLEIILGRSTVVETEVPIVRASLANPAVADAVVLSPRQVYVTGMGVGVTNLTLSGATVSAGPT